MDEKIKKYFEIGKYLRYGGTLSKITNVYEIFSGTWKVCLDNDLDYRFGEEFYKNVKKANGVKDSLFECIQVGDYVNGYRVREVKEDYIETYDLEKDIIKKDEIEIVTPRQKVFEFGYETR